MDEKELVLGAKAGDREAFSSLYTLYKDRLYRYALYRTGNALSAEDAVSVCVLSAYEQIGKLKKPEAFSAWIFKILYYACGAELKALAQRRKMADIQELGERLSDDFSSAIEKTELQQALDTLKEDEKSIVLLSVVAGLSSREIAKISELTPSAVRSKLSRSLKKMRDFLGDTYEEE